MRGWVRLLLAGALAGTLPGCRSSPQVAAAGAPAAAKEGPAERRGQESGLPAGAADQPLFRLPADVHPTREAVELEVVPDREGFTGRVAITLRLEQPRTDLYLSARELKLSDATLQLGSEVLAVAIEPDDAWHGIEGLKHMASSIVPGIYHEEELDRKINVSTDAAYETVYRLGSEEGLVVGQSSGAAMFGALQVARELTEGVVVLILCDFGDRYLSTNLWVGWRDWQNQSRQQAR